MKDEKEIKKLIQTEITLESTIVTSTTAVNYWHLKVKDNQKLFHRCQHTKNQLNSAIHS